ncbi:hypothetical protein N9K64_02395 [Rhodobacteraceae bacterium]|nr:hypothetical protein [Paracoccaceae bacterium]
MRFLKLFLWITLATCITWGSTIVLGPALISRALNATFAGSLEVNRLNVSPKLKITASFLKFDNLGNMDSIPLRGIVRGIDLSWKIADGFKLIAKLGPSRIEGVGALEAATVTFTPRGLFDWNSAELVATLSSLTVGHAIVEQVTVTAGLSDNFGSLERAVMTGMSVKNESVDISAEEFILSFSNLDLRRSIEKQDISFNLDILDSLIGVAGHAQGVNLSGVLRGPSVVFDISVDKATSPEFEVVINGMSASSRYDLWSKHLGPTARISAARITAESANVNIVDYSGEIHLFEDRILTNGTMTIESLVLKSGANFIAKISDAKSQYKGRLQKKTDKEYPFNVDVKLQVTDDLRVVSSLGASLMASDLTSCLAENCAITDGSIRYLVELPSAKLTGESHCAVEICLFDQMRHSVTTDNTDVFFAELAEERVFSPFAIPLAYYAVRGALPIGFGHKLDF